MTELIAQLFALFLPVVRDIVDKYKAAHHGALPTDEEVTKAFEDHIREYLEEGAEWKRTHPSV